MKCVASLALVFGLVAELTSKRGGFLIRHISGFDCHQRILRHTQILGIRSHALTAISENLVAFSESFYILTDCFHFPGKLTPQNIYSWFCESKIYS